MNHRFRISALTASFFLTVFLLAGCRPKNESIPLIDGTVDMFDDGNRMNDLGYEWESVSGGGETTASIFINPGGEGNDSIYELLIGGTRPFGSSGAQVSGARVALGKNGTSANVTAYEGLEVSMTGTPGSYIVQIGTAAVTDHDYYNSYVEVTELWNVFRIPFGLFMQEGFGAERPFTRTDLTHIAIYSNLTGPYNLSVDNVRFY